jgi:hypothetical protein
LLVFATMPAAAQTTNQNQQPGTATQSIQQPGTTGQSMEQPAKAGQKPGTTSQSLSNFKATSQGMEKPGVTETHKGIMPKPQSLRETNPGIAKRNAAGAQNKKAEKLGASSQAKQANKQVKGGEATVARVDRPRNCLRIRSNSAVSSKILGCAPSGKKLRLNGVFSKDGRWAQLDNNGGVFFSQLRTSVRPPQGVASAGSWKRPAAAGGVHKRVHRRIRYRFHGSCGAPVYYPGYSWYGY